MKKLFLILSISILNLNAQEVPKAPSISDRNRYMTERAGRATIEQQQTTERAIRDAELAIQEATSLRQEAQQAATNSSTTSATVPNVSAAAVSTSATTSKSMEYAYIYSEQGQLVKTDESIVFEKNGEMTSGIKHIEKSSEIIFERAGTYQISFSAIAYTGQPYERAAGLFINGMLIKGGRTSLKTITEGPQALPIQNIIRVNAGDKLTVRNCGFAHLQTPSILLQLKGSEGRISTSASILITQLA